MPKNSSHFNIPNLKTEMIGRKIIHYDLIDSTQTSAKELAQQNAFEGTVVIAEKQSSGKGRMGRCWISEQGGIWASIILRPDIPPDQVHLLPLVFSVAISDAIEKSCKMKCGLKWPNDVMIKVPASSAAGQQCQIFKKVGGILTEMSAESDKVNWVVLGFGINVNNKIPDSLKSTAISLKNTAKKEIDRISLLQNLLSEIETDYFSFLKKGFALFKKEYLKKSVLRNKKITILNMSKEKKGKYCGIDKEGALILLMDNGKKEKFLAGDVTIGS